MGTVLADSWFGNVKNMALMVEKGEQFIIPLKANRQGALVDATDSTKTEYVPVQSLELQEDTPVSVWLKGYSKPLL
ncbi:MAG: IS701 family transposase, partial [Bacteroidota bacterium]